MPPEQLNAVHWSSLSQNLSDGIVHRFVWVNWKLLVCFPPKCRDTSCALCSKTGYIKSFLDNKKITKEFSICWRGGVNQHMENSICFVIFFESFPYLITLYHQTTLIIIHFFDSVLLEIDVIIFSHKIVALALSTSFFQIQRF